MGYRYSANSDWGEIFGLKPTDLTIQQLEKINTNKLVEFASIDPRVEQIIGNRIARTTNVDEVKALKSLLDIEFNNLPYIKIKYNECIALNSECLDISNKKSRWRANRSDFVWWNKLSTGNKCQEFIRWIDDKDSIVDANKIDFNWLHENHEWITDSVIVKVFNSKVARNITKMIPQLPEKYMLRYLKRIFECDKAIYVHSLSNIHTPNDYIIKALRAIAGKKKVPSVRVTLSKALLEKLPPVMRLRVLESMLIYMRGGNVSFSDIDSEEDLGALLFSIAIKYNVRVQQVVKRFKNLCT